MEARSVQGIGKSLRFKVQCPCFFEPSSRQNLAHGIGKSPPESTLVPLTWERQTLKQLLASEQFPAGNIRDQLREIGGGPFFLIDVIM